MSLKPQDKAINSIVIGNFMRSGHVRSRDPERYPLIFSNNVISISNSFSAVRQRLELNVNGCMNNIKSLACLLIVLKL